MPYRVTDLAHGDRVILNCPKSRVSTHRTAEFRGCYTSVEQAMRVELDIGLLISQPTADFLSHGAWAAFLMQTTSDGLEVRAAFAIEEDGTMRDDEGRRIFIERRLGRANQG